MPSFFARRTMNCDYLKYSERSYVESMSSLFVVTRSIFKAFNIEMLISVLNFYLDLYFCESLKVVVQEEK